MNERRRILQSSIGLILATSLSTALVTIYFRYEAAMAGTRARLTEEVESHATLIGAVAHFEPALAADETDARSIHDPLERILDVTATFRNFGETGEFTLARREGEHIAWLIEHRHPDSSAAEHLTFDSMRAEPMQRALSGESGTLIGRDYRGERVLAAYAPIPELGWGIVAKIDLAEINAPFVREFGMAAGIACLFVSLGVVFTLRATSPQLRLLESRSEELGEARDRLEAGIAERTTQLSEANRSLREEIQERRRTEAALRRERDFAESLIDTARMIVLLLDTEGRIVRYNRYLEELSGFRIEEVQGKDWFSTFLPRRDHGRIREVFSNSLSGIRTRGTVNPILTKAGVERDIEWYDAMLKDEAGALVGILAVGHDVSEQRRLERQLRAAASEAALTEERERRKLASDLHDGISQLLTLSKMKLGMLRGSAGMKGLAESVREIEALIGEAHSRAGSLTFELSPPILHDVGLAAAAQWLAEDMQRRFGLHIAIADGGPHPPLDEASGVTLFRSLQEVLINVVKHAEVDKASVRLWHEEHQMKICIEDEGVGFDPEPGTVGFGLLSIGERLHHLGGGLEIESTPAAGTKIVLSAPIAGAAARGREDSA
jgi:PAS domain S-box-containing protein